MKGRGKKLTTFQVFPCIKLRISDTNFALADRTAEDSLPHVGRKA